ncbi:MAG: GNAT family N-acetyltransferase [Gemmatimonadota bacterium]|nr:GNAT family N-acetyltransferase [Gemmatimonadota bacterium]
MPTDLKVTVELAPDPADTATVLEGLLAFNVAMIGEPNREPVTVFVRDDAGAVVGGLIGEIKWGWLYVSKLWVDDRFRGRGAGSALMNAAEAHARSRGCANAYLDTFEYQARPFYERLGYELFGTLEGFPPGYRQFYLTKKL